MSAFGAEYLNLTLGDLNLLRASPSDTEIRASYIVMAVLFVGCLIALPFATEQWPASHVLDAGAGVACFAETTTGLLLLIQARLLRRYSGFALGLGYLLGGLIVLVTILVPENVSTNLWLFRLWHGVFVTGVLAYAVLHVNHDVRARRMGLVRMGPAVGGALLFTGLLVLYLFLRPFSLPVIIHGRDYTTAPNLFINGIQFTIIALAWWMLLTTPRKTVLSVWMTVVAFAVAIDIILFVLGGKLQSAGLYVSKLNNLVAATLIFGVIFHRYIRIQATLYRHRIGLLRANRRLMRMALKDGLTGLPNRMALDQCLDEALARAARTMTQVAVCVIDLDDFKKINDQYGHEAGDGLLRAFGKRVAGILRKGEKFARLGGDEFVLVLESLQGTGDLAAVMMRMTHILSEPFVLPQMPLFCLHVSVGVALYPDCASASDLMRAADQALYRAKADKARRTQNWVVCGSGDLAAGMRPGG
ncbi:MAG: diguanylate cyclase [Gammaproteobacteria bacterium]|nr:diguanylate cyclase [Gammaproteobacteria bacterium]